MGTCYNRISEVVLTCTSNHNLCFEQNKQTITNFLLKIIIFTAMKNHIILHMCVFVMSLQYGDAELYYRIVNMREAEISSMQQISTANYNQYTAPQVRQLK